jgi:hypothetical protein
MKTRSLDRTLAKQDPEGNFDTPFDIARETLLTRGEKIAALNRWREAILQELRASGYRVRHGREQLLGQIEEAKTYLGCQ